MNTPVTRVCLECGEPLSGRADKKFCNDVCRSAYNNKQISGSRTPIVRHIHRILLRNRQILSQMTGEKEAIKVSGRKLRDAGFDFRYHTHTYVNAKQVQYIFVFEYGYLKLDNDWYFVVRRDLPLGRV